MINLFLMINRFFLVDKVIIVGNDLEEIDKLSNGICIGIMVGILVKIVEGV